MRKGQNPAKKIKDVQKPSRITVAILNYIPFISGFYKESLDVLKISLKSLLSSTNLDIDLMVFDNGSCNEVQDYLLDLQRKNQIQYLILSKKNLGKGGAWNHIFAGAPGEIIAYADSDVLFLPFWLERSLELLETFPNVGMVTSRPFRTKSELFSNTLNWATNSTEAKIHNGQLIPWQTFLEFNLSLGHNEEEIRKIYDSTQDVWVEYKNKIAVLGASHWQFVAYKSVLNEFIPFDMNRPMGQVRQLDELINERSLLRLMVPEPLVLNMSNTLINVPGRKTANLNFKKPKKRFIDLTFIKKPLMFLYDKIFYWYYFD
jgi:glycosyltransferase involved in cell wall biosynthesis